MVANRLTRGEGSNSRCRALKRVAAGITPPKKSAGVVVESSVFFLMVLVRAAARFRRAGKTI